MTGGILQAEDKLIILRSEDELEKLEVRRRP